MCPLRRGERRCCDRLRALPRASWSQRIATVNESRDLGNPCGGGVADPPGREFDRRVRRRLLGRRRSGSAASESGEALAGASSPTALGVMPVPPEPLIKMSRKSAARLACVRVRVPPPAALNQRLTGILVNTCGLPIHTSPQTALRRREQWCGRGRWAGSWPLSDCELECQVAWISVGWSHVVCDCRVEKTFLAHHVSKDFFEATERLGFKRQPQPHVRAV